MPEKVGQGEGGIESKGAVGLKRRAFQLQLS